MSKRKVVVYNTQGEHKTEVTFTGDFWEDLQDALGKAGIPYQGMRAIIGENQVTLESPKAVLPKGLTVGDKVTDNFTLFLSPVKNKSGATRREMIKEIIAVRKTDEKAAGFFKNYTKMDTKTIAKKLKRWYKNAEKRLPEKTDCEEKSVTVIEYATSSLRECIGIINDVLETLAHFEEVDDESIQLEELRQKALEIEENLRNI